MCVCGLGVGGCVCSRVVGVIVSLLLLLLRLRLATAVARALSPEGGLSNAFGPSGASSFVRVHVLAVPRVIHPAKHAYTVLLLLLLLALCAHALSRHQGACPQGHPSREKEYPSPLGHIGTQRSLSRPFGEGGARTCAWPFSSSCHAHTRLLPPQRQRGGMARTEEEEERHKACPSLSLSLPHYTLHLSSPIVPYHGDDATLRSPSLLPTHPLTHPPTHPPTREATHSPPPFL